MSDYTDLIADARVWPRDGVSKGPLINALADAIEALVKERDEQGSCWDEGMTLPVREGECAPVPPKCELPHGHGGAHRAGRQEWMRRDSYNSVVAERDALAAVVEKAKNLAAEAGRFREADVDSWVNVYALKKVLYTAPADALREHDRQVAERAWEEGARWAAVEFGRDAFVDESRVGLVPSDNPYRKEQENNNA